MKRIFAVTSFLFSIYLSAQTYPENDFIHPLKIDLKLAGNFAELRGFHFHSGIDIKTNQREGYNIYAIADGYVSRINVSPRGYGNAVYITHPNGYTSVYAHLQQYKGEIDKHIRAEQYKQQKFAIDISVPKGEIPVKQGDVIALSGNTGSSGGPHLHFEIRDTQTQETINPFFFGINIPDHKNPLINGMYVYALNGNVSGKKRYDLTSGLTYKSPIYASGKVALGVKAYDKHDGANNMNGVHSIDVYSNGEKMYTYTANRFAFNQTRYINCITDYAQYMTNKTWIYQLYRMPGNLSPMLSNLENDGILEVKEGEKYNIQIVVSDYAGNQTKGSFVIVGKTPPTEKAITTGENYLYWDRENYFKNEDIEIWMPKESLYQDYELSYKKANGKYYIGSDKMPLHKFYTLAIQPENIPTHLLDKAVIAVQYQYGSKRPKDYFPTEYKNQKLIADVRDFGAFTIEVDDNKPSILSINIKENATFTASNGVIKFTIKDSQSGIQKHDAYIDGKWILTAYDKKNHRLTLDLNKEGIDTGNHTLELKVTDGKNNTATYKVNFKKAS